MQLVKYSQVPNKVVCFLAVVFSPTKKVRLIIFKPLQKKKKNGKILNTVTESKQLYARFKYRATVGHKLKHLMIFKFI